MPEAATGRVTWLGHASVLIDLDGVRLLTDPLLTRRVHLLRRRVPAPAVPAGVDAILLSHLHRDHVHLRSLKLVAPGARVLAPAGAGRLLARSGAAEVIEMAPGHRDRPPKRWAKDPKSDRKADRLQLVRS